MTDKTIPVIVIGAGHSGLSMSYQLQRRGVEHVVFEKGTVADSWKRQRWSSFRLLTPNHFFTLPGMQPYKGDPDGFLTVAETVQLIEAYAQAIAAPVEEQTIVTGLFPCDTGFMVETSSGVWRSSAVIVASGPANRATLPTIAGGLPAEIDSLTGFTYRAPAGLQSGGVLVVGASATGVQIASELCQHGHHVTLSVGEHIRAPRRYRGRDLFHWMQLTGILDQGIADIDDIRRARQVPSLQLAGDPNHTFLDLNRLQAEGVQIVGRLVGLNGYQAQFSGSLANMCALSDLKMNRLLHDIDNWIAKTGTLCPPSQRFAPTAVDADPPLSLSLKSAGIRTVIWATGFEPDLSWLKVPVFDRKKRLRHHGGVTEWPGLYVMGQPFLRRRKSSFICGAEDDSRELADHLIDFLAKP